ncbi:co-chaperone YbbN [Janibacter sp. YB324]|uniref:co-chaperone YbbN n=1 Tax=Janibacter sp. YB324 TaxID=2761047 RepID=UPI0016284643|nr:tetratricopeptide repeat protein [Janibacter sp. YB324]QNF95025.1 tetratricopeptide repeat protein [Janibacter sp. YB324]
MNDPTRALRGAVDLSGLGGPARPSTPAGAPAGPTQTGAAGPAAPAAPGAPGGSPGGAPAPAAGGSLDALLVEATDATFNQVVSRSGVVPSVAVVWSSEHPESQALLRDALDIATGLEGRLQVVSIDIATNPQIAQAIQPPEVPLALGLVGGQPVPLFSGLVDREQFRQVLDQLLQVAVQHGITGRVSADQVPEGAEEELPPLHQEAYDAIERGDLDAAAAAYDKAIAADPKDTDAQLGLAQVGLMKRTQGVDLQAARAAAAGDPSDVDAALVVADLDVLGGHVEDAFTRLIDLVRVTAGEERDRVKTHLLDLFAVVGNHDERVRKGRTTLMSALF